MSSEITLMSYNEEIDEGSWGAEVSTSLPPAVPMICIQTTGLTSHTTTI